MRKGNLAGGSLWTISDLEPNRGSDVSKAMLEPVFDDPNLAMSTKTPNEQSKRRKNSDADGYYVFISLISAVLLSTLAIVAGLGLALTHASFALSL